MGFDAAIRPLSTIEVKVENKSGTAVYTENTKALSGYRTFSQYTSELGYNLIDNAQTYYKLTSNAQLANLLYNANNKLVANHLYTIKYKVNTQSENTGWKTGDTFLIYNLTGYERVPRLLAFYGVSNSKQFLVDNNMMDDLLVQKNQVIIRNPTKNQDKVYQPAALSDNDKRMIDADLMGRNQHCEYGYEPINLNTGNFLYSNTDAGYIEFDTPFEVSRNYNSISLGKDSVFGRNWSFSLQENLYFSETGNVEYEDSTGRIVTFEKNSDGTYKTPYGTSYSLTKVKEYSKEYTVDSGYYDKEESPKTTKINVDYYKYTLRSSQGNDVKEFNHYGNITKHTLSNGGSNIYTYGTNGYFQSFKTAGGKEFTFTYNNDGHITKVVTPNGKQLLYGYDNAGNLTEFVDQDGFSIKYAYDNNFRMLSYTSRETNNLVIKNTYNNNGQITTQTDALGNVSSFSYGTGYTEITDYEGNVERVYIDNHGYTKKIEKTDGNNTSNIYDSKGNLVQETLENGIVFNYTYDTNNRIKSMTNEYAQTKYYEYDNRGNIVKQTDFDGKITSYTYSSNNELLKTIFEDGTYTEKTYQNGQIKSERDIYGDVKTYTYNNGQKTITTYSDGTSTSFTYDSLGFLTKETNRLGVVTNYNYDSRGQLISANVGGNTTQYVYNGDGEKVSETDPNGNVTLYEYDGWSRVSKITTLDGSKEYVYDANGNKIQETNELDQTTTYTYDLNNKLLTTTDHTGRVSSNVYDVNGNVVETTSMDGITTYKEYDALGKVIKETTRDRSTEYEYNHKGQLVSTTNYLGQTSTQVYDELGNVITSTDYLGNITENTYNLGRLTETNVNGLVTKYVYDTSGNVVEEINTLDETINETQYLGGVANSYTIGDTITTKYAYNAQGYLASVTDALGNTTSYTYDGNGNEISVMDANGNVTTKQYDHANRIIKETTAQGYTKTYTYDALGREIEQSVHDVVNDGIYTTQTIYNENGSVEETIDELGRSTLYSYDEFGRTQEVDSYGRVTQYEYDEYGNKIKETTPSKTTNYTYNENDLLIQEVDSLGYEKTYTYDEKNQLIVEEDNRYGYTEYLYNDKGLVIEQKDLRGNTQTFTYNELDQKVSETDILGNTTYYSYSTSGQLLSETSETEVVENEFNETGRISSYTTQIDNPVTLTYDNVGNVIEVIDVLGNVVTFTYNKDNQKISETDSLGNTTEFVYDARGNVIETIYADGSTTQSKYDAGNRKVMDVNDAGFETIYEYNDYDELIKTIDTLGNEETVNYDELGQEISRVDALGNVIENSYNDKHQLIETKDGRGNTTSYVYNDKNELIQTKYPNGLETSQEYNEYGDLVLKKSNGKEGVDEAYTYNELGQKISATDIKGVTVYYTYDSLGNLNTTTTDDLTLETIEYDEFNRKAKTIDTYGLEATYTYDILGNLIEETHSNGYSITFVYDSEGNLLKEVDGRGETVYEYDTNHRLVKTTYSDGTTLEKTYDILGQVTEIKNRQNQVESYIYDELGREISKTDTAGYETRTEYDAVGNIIKTQDAYGTILEFIYDENNNLVETKHNDTWVSKKEYDSANQLIKVTDSEFNRDTYTYDIYGNLIDKNEMNTQTSFTYDDRNNPIQQKTTNGVYTFEYDEKSNLISSSSDKGTSQYTYDEFGNLLDHTDPNGYTISYTYTETGDIEKITYPGGKEVKYIYDEYRRIVEIQNGTESILYTYDSMDNLISLETEVTTTHYTYTNGTVSNQTTENKITGERNVDLDYIYNETGYIEKEINNLTESTKEYEYDAWGQITKEIRDEVETDYTYDKKGNRKTSTTNGEVTHYSYSASNQLLKVDKPNGLDISYQYDDLGNATLKTYENGYEETYSYDGLNQLIKIENNDGRIIEYSYDALGNRIGKEDTYNYRSIIVGNSPDSVGLDPKEAIKQAKEAYSTSLIEERVCTYTGEQSDTTTISTQYVNDINLEYEVAIETYRNGVLDTQNVFDGSILSQTKQDTQSYTTRNVKGDVITSTNILGEEETYSYDIFGKPTSEKVPNLGYNGEVHEGSLQYLRARYYDTETGTFITRDTYRGEDTDIQSQNRYTYVGNNPVNYKDPSGHKMEMAPEAGGGKKKNPGGCYIGGPVLPPNIPKSKPLPKLTPPSSRGPGWGNTAPRVTTNPKSSTAKAKESAEKVEKEYQTIQQKLNDKERIWKSSGLTQSEIDALRVGYVRQYCEDLGFTTVETNMMLKKLGLIENQVTASGKKQAESPNKPWYSDVLEFVDDIIDLAYKEILEIAKKAVLNVILAGVFVLGGILIYKMTVEALVELLSPYKPLILAGVAVALAFAFPPAGAVTGTIATTTVTSAGTLVMSTIAIEVSYAVIAQTISMAIFAYAVNAGGESDSSGGSEGTGSVNSSDVTYNDSSVDKAFSKHSGDFGNYPDGSSNSVNSFKNDLSNFIDNPNNIQKPGTW